MAACHLSIPAPPNCADCRCVPANVWDDAPADVAAILSARKSFRTLKKGSYLFHQGGECDAIYRLLSGVLLLRKGDHDGNSLVVRMVRPGATMGYRALVRGEPHAVSAHCATDITICNIPAHAARWAFEQNRALERDFAADMVRDIDRSENQALNMLSLCVRDRVLVLLHQMAEHFGERDGDGLRIRPPVSKSDMAAMLGIARESMSRCIRAVEEQGLVTFDHDGVYAPSFDRFHASVVEILGRAGGAGHALMF